VWFVGILLNDYVLKFMGSMCVFGWNVVDGLGVEIYGFNVWFCWNKYGDECEIENRNILIFVDNDVAGGAVGIEPSSRQEQPRSRAGRWITPLFLYDT